MKVKQVFRKKFHQSQTSSIEASYHAVAGLLVLSIGTIITPVSVPVGAVMLAFGVSLMGMGMLTTPFSIIVAAFE